MAAVLPTPTSEQDSSPDPSRHGLKPLGWLRALFSRPVKIKRVGKQLHVVLEEKRPIRPNSRSSGRGEALRLAHVALQDLLSQHEDSRRMMPHLSHVEETLARMGSRALVSLPENVLRKSMDQLDILEGSPQNDDLMALRLRVEEVLKRRVPARPRDDVSSIEVTDASHSQYDEADRHWTGIAPLDEAVQHAK